MTRILLEVCVDDAAGIAAAAAGGADRIELCAALALGGLTPSAGLMRLAAEGPLPALAMIRPRAGGFVWSEDEARAMHTEIAAVRAFGLAGVVIGASRPDGRLDEGTLARLVEAAEGLDVTLHRAIDLVPDVAEAMAVCVRLGIRRVLSSGGAATAPAGIGRLAAMAAAEPSVTVMPGGGVGAANAAALAARLPLREVHASCSTPVPPPADPKVREFGFQPADARATDAGRVRDLRAALDRIATA
ncbi:MAG: copper homeostasis protein CutC [Proteobacteria bacterium]|nr:copper homeostasis protein CutC [Pseudomonadota bacterium]MBS0571938.1 copper homeostasis protein CutC [Pseudomonadota bacterium]